MRKQAVGPEWEIRGIALLFSPLKHPFRIGRREKQESRFCKFETFTVWSYGKTFLATRSLSRQGSSFTSPLLSISLFEIVFFVVSSKNSEGEVACPARTITQITSMPSHPLQDRSSNVKVRGAARQALAEHGKRNLEAARTGTWQSPCAMLCTVSNGRSFSGWVPTGGTKSIAKKYFPKWIPRQGFSMERKTESVRLQKQRNTSTQGLLNSLVHSLAAGNLTWLSSHWGGGVPKEKKGFR